MELFCPTPLFLPRMKLRGIIALLFILVLSIPMLPIREVGKLLSTNQITEEINHGAETGKTNGKVFQFQEEVIHDVENNSTFLTAVGSAYIAYVSKLPAPHEGEIPTPPPNRLA